MIKDLIEKKKPKYFRREERDIKTIKLTKEEMDKYLKDIDKREIKRIQHEEEVNKRI